MAHYWSKYIGNVGHKKKTLKPTLPQTVQTPDKTVYTARASESETAGCVIQRLKRLPRQICSTDSNHMTKGIPAWLCQGYTKWRRLVWKMTLRAHDTLSQCVGFVRSRVTMTLHDIRVLRSVVCVGEMKRLSCVGEVKKICAGIFYTSDLISQGFAPFINNSLSVFQSLTSQAVAGKQGEKRNRCSIT